MKESIAEIKAIIREIEKVDELLLNFKEGNDSSLRILTQEFLRKKRSLVKELITALVQSPIDKRFFKGLYQKAFEYLEKSDSHKEIENNSELKVFFKKAETLMSANG